MGLQSKLFIGGEFVDAAERATIATLNPHDNSVLAEVAEARREDVDRPWPPLAPLSRNGARWRRPIVAGCF
jgi:acyl-CoA reductase-like NAD-dependent aldehyde dehydrogenase